MNDVLKGGRKRQVYSVPKSSHLKEWTPSAPEVGQVALNIFLMASFSSSLNFLTWLVFPGVTSPVAQTVKRESWVRSLGWEGPLEEEMTTDSSVLAWRTPWTEKPGGLQSKGCQESDTTE